ncbi:circadian associated repressor of transcription a [Centropristis striata]|uniref:circadian associated repressor of transcription a n=1 Tax=Centropristis striata TaxID=184440 RepID=UPI0027DF9DAF|nr:circadian associated repressor of transcription a [Centropristis striata]
MNSLGSSSKWTSYDSLTSTSSFLFSESEQTEDEDVFSEGEGYTVIRKPLSGDEGITLSEKYLGFPAHSNQLHSRSKSDQPEHCPNETKHLDPASSPGVAALGSSSATPGDLAFAQKCADLQRFICPLLELLQGLKTGRFDKGLSSFQQSVAVDRLHRILGILQRPEMGEKYLQNLLQIEMMLKIWFPRVAFQSSVITVQTTTPRIRPRWRQNQLHMPVKKRKLSWSDSDNSCEVPTKQMHYQHGKYGSCQAATPLDSVATCLPESPKQQRAPEEETVKQAEGSCTAEHEFTYSTDTSVRRLQLWSKRGNEYWKQSEISQPSACERLATQDSSVSSSNITTTSDSP